MQPVRPVEHAVPFHAIEPVVKDSCLQRIWNAVVYFFTSIAKFISDGIEATWNCLKNVFCPVKTVPLVVQPQPVPLQAAPPEMIQPQPVQLQAAPPQVIQPGVAAVPIVRAPATLGEKLALYSNMPHRNIDFVQRSVNAFQEILRRKEEANIAAQNNERPLQAFNDNFTYMMNIVDVAQATVRGYVLSDSTANGRILTFFNQVAGQRQGEYNNPIRDPLTGQLIHIGGYEMIDVYEDRTIRLGQLRDAFNRLPNPEKEVILDTTDLGNFNRLPISANAKEVLNGIAQISNLLHQHNPPFTAAVQAVHGNLTAAAN